jgi:hypothetical protein
MTDSLPVAEVDFHRVARVSKQSELTDVRLAYCFARGGAEPAQPRADWGERAFGGFDLSLSQVAQSDQAFAVRVEFIALYFDGWDFRETPDPPSGDAEPAVHIAADFVCAYQCVKGAELEPGDLEHFASVNTLMHAWPYWREFAQATSVRLGLTPIHVGLLPIPSALDTGE